MTEGQAGEQGRGGTCDARGRKGPYLGNAAFSINAHTYASYADAVTPLPLQMGAWPSFEVILEVLQNLRKELGTSTSPLPPIPIRRPENGRPKSQEGRAGPFSLLAQLRLCVCVQWWLRLVMKQAKSAPKPGAAQLPVRPVLA
eukprot:1158782-Pelagomonas_calceolata.AAC.7